MKGYWGVKESSLSIPNTMPQLCFQPSVEAGLKKEKEKTKWEHKEGQHTGKSCQREAIC